MTIIRNIFDQPQPLRVDYRGYVMLSPRDNDRLLPIEKSLHAESFGRKCTLWFCHGLGEAIGMLGWIAGVLAVGNYFGWLK